MTSCIHGLNDAIHDLFKQLHRWLNFDNAQPFRHYFVTFTTQEKTLKQQLKIASTLILLLAINISFANGVETKPKKSQDQEQQTLQTGQKGEVEEQKLEDVVEEPIEDERSIKTDSVEDDSVSKYNFIFYFLYKFKYEEEA